MGTLRESIAALRTEASAPTGVIVLTMEYSEESDIWVGQCLELGTPAEAPTSKELRQELVEAVHLQLEQVQELGFIDAFLRNHGVALFPLGKEPRPGGRGTGWRLPELAAA